MSKASSDWIRTQMPRSADGTRRDPIAMLVLYALSDRHSDKPDGHLFPGQRLISQDTGLSRSTVSAKLAQLEAQGYLIRKKRYNRRGGPRRGQRTTDEYFLNLKRPADDLVSREEQPKHLRRKTPVGNESTNPDRESPEIPSALPDFMQAHRSDRHLAGSSKWSDDDLMDEVEARMTWAFDRVRLNRPGFAAYLAGMRKRLGTSKELERAAVTALFESAEDRQRMAADLRTAQKVVQMAVAEALIAAREGEDHPDVRRLKGLAREKYDCTVATDGTQYPNTPEGRADRDACDRRLERLRLGLS